MVGSLTGFCTRLDLHCVLEYNKSLPFRRPRLMGGSSWCITCLQEHPCPLVCMRMCVRPQVTAIFRSSVEVMISVWGETPEHAGEMFHCGDAYATIVSGGKWVAGDDVAGVGGWWR